MRENIIFAERFWGLTIFEAPNKMAGTEEQVFPSNIFHMSQPLPDPITVTDVMLDVTDVMLDIT